MMQAANKVDGRVLWANLALLFWLTLIPFMIRWIGETGISAWPVAAYGAVLIMTAIAYLLLERSLIAVEGSQSRIQAAVGAKTKEWVELRGLRRRGAGGLPVAVDLGRDLYRRRDDVAGPRSPLREARLASQACKPAARFPPLLEQRSGHLESWHGTTILGVKKGGRTVIAGDGQVSLGNTVIKPNAKKVRRLGADGKVIGGFAGATADAFTLFERLEKKLEQYNGQLMRAAVELAKDWRTDKYLRQLEAMMIVADAEVMLILTGTGDVLEPEMQDGGGIAAIGSGGNYALAAARALADYEDDPEVLARRAMGIAAEVCVFTNDRLTIESVGE